jgi:hypothetical protein
MLSGFANENMGQNRFMARTRQLNSSFSNAIGTKEVTPLPDIYRNVRKAPLNQIYANAIGKTTYVKPSPTQPAALAGCSGTSGYICMNCPGWQGPGSPSYCPSTPGDYDVWHAGSSDLESNCGCSFLTTNPDTSKPRNVSVKFDGGFANAYGNPVQRASRPLVYNPYKNASGGCGCGCNGDALLGL